MYFSCSSSRSIFLKTDFSQIFTQLYILTSRAVQTVFLEAILGGNSWGRPIFHRALESFTLTNFYRAKNWVPFTVFSSILCISEKKRVHFCAQRFLCFYNFEVIDKNVVCCRGSLTEISVQILVNMNKMKTKFFLSPDLNEIWHRWSHDGYQILESEIISWN